MNDPKITKAMLEWSKADHSSEEMIVKGATLLLQVNRNKGLFMRICHNPSRGLAKLEYEIRKHLAYRQDGLNIEDVVKMDQQLQKVLPKQAEINACVKTLREIDNPPFHPDEVIPVAEDGASIVRGKRPDHDSLPGDIKAIWEKNCERWRKIKASFELLKTLKEPCDRYEYVKAMKEAWYAYRKDMNRYDEYKGSMDELVTVTSGRGLTVDEQKEVDLAQAYISKSLPKLLDLVEMAQDPDFDKAEQLEAKRSAIQQRVDTLLKYKVLLSDQRKADLRSCDIRIVPDDAQGKES
ncbi:MAG: hypothetical protein K5683_02850 [Prevotella sp.]|nr:hypothetical protein [Prevotella sp.]